MTEHDDQAAATVRPAELSDAELIERLRRRPFDRWGMEAARRLEALREAREAEDRA